MLLNKEILIGIYSAPLSLSTTIIWTGLGSNNNWSTAQNWNIINVPQAYNILQFAGTTRLTPFNDLVIDTPYNGITFNAGAGSFTLGGNRFVLNSGSITNNSNNTQTINNNIILDTNAGTINCNTSNINLNGNISGSGSLTKLGTSTLQLSGNNTYTGNTFISAGYVNIFNSNPFGTGIVNIFPGVGPVGTTDGANITIPYNNILENTIINNQINLGGTGVGLATEGVLIVNKSATFNGGINFTGIRKRTTITIDQWGTGGPGVTAIFTGGFVGPSNLGSGGIIFQGDGPATIILSSLPFVFNDASSNIQFFNQNHTFIIATTGNNFGTMFASCNIRTDVPLAINGSSVNMDTDRSGRINLNGNDQVFSNITAGVPLNKAIFNNSSTFANLTVNNTRNTTYNSAISGNINLIKTGTYTQTLSGINRLTYTGFTAISAGTLINYALSSNPSNKVNFASFTNTALTVNFTTPPSIGDVFILLPGRTINSYPSVTLQNVNQGTTASYNSTTSTLSVIS